MLFGKSIATSQSATLRKNMISLGTIKGRTYQEVIKVVGEPTVMQTKAEGGILCSWNSPKYAINLGFDANRICTGVFGEKIIK